MRVVLLSGGSGKRLWPLSSDSLSKQFLKLLKNDDGEYVSMAQRVLGQLQSIHPSSEVFVSCNEAQEDILKEQLGDAESILEPSRRDTFPAILLAAAYLHYVKRLPEDEVFVVCPIDVFAERHYFELLADVEKLVTSGTSKIGLLGVQPTYPSAKYGYILQNGGVVKGFVEKPSEQDAENLISEGALWNTCVFALKIGYVLDCARKLINFDSFDALYAQYDKLPQTSFDYAVLEKESSLSAVTYSGVWKDLGTWNTLTEEMSDTFVGKVLPDNCENAHVLNMLGIPIIVQDMQDVVIVAGEEGILVSSKHGSSFLKPLAEKVGTL